MLKQLIDFGLSEKEAKVYLALLELGSSSVTQVAKKADVKRTNTYHLLEALVSYGLVRPDTAKGKKAVFVAERPEEFLFLMKERMHDAKKKYEDSKDLIAELRAIYNSDTERKVRVRYFAGSEGLVNVYEDSLACGGEILAFTTFDYQKILKPGYFPGYWSRRVAKGINVKCITADSKEGRFLKKMDKEHLRETRLVPEKFRISPEINVYGDRTAVLSLKEKFGVIIESKEVASAFKKLFELAYERAGKYEQEVKPKKKKK